MKRIEIEFFHDVICSFCFPMSYMLRKIKKEIEEVDIIHRSFALMKKDEYFEIVFGSHEEAKKEILTHWEQANRFDEKSRFNIEGMMKQKFLFPSSMIPLKAAMAGKQMGGEDLYWDIFDKLQDDLFVKNLNINDMDIINQSIKELNIDIIEWEKLFKSDEIKKMVEKELELGKKLQIKSAPTLIINRKYLINGVMPYEKLKEIILDIKEKELTN